MSILAFTLIVWTGSLVAGFVGALTGLGGGVVIVPLLALALGVDIRYAVGASLVSVIATSSGAAAAYVREGFTNIRIGMLLEIATTFGAIAGALVAALVTPSVVAIIFGGVLIYSAYASSRPRPADAQSAKPDRLASRLRLNGAYPDKDGKLINYSVRNVPGGFALMGLAGVLSGLLGIGSGAVKVLAMDQAMRIPFKVSTTTSNFMIGVTAAASAGVYLHRGYIDPGLAMPVMLGVLIGSLVGARVLAHSHPAILRKVFAVVILALGLEMIFNGLTGRI
ncbi:MAG: sulfite exporter TauE/SafE family protein [Armatimonadetes bacterium]|nr:sulfite exporter TauE/SafE family protein [Armatimonadota bacterium]